MLAAWWAGLTEPERTQLRGLWDAEARTLGEPDDEDAWVVLLEARFVEPTQLELEPEEEELASELELFEYLLRHGQLVAPRILHICRAHPAAMAVARSGVVPADFRCPLGRERCPLRSLLSVEPGRTVVLRVVGLAKGRRVLWSSRGELAGASA